MSELKESKKMKKEKKMSELKESKKMKKERKKERKYSIVEINDTPRRMRA